MSAVGAHSVRPSSVDHDARRARRLGAPPYKVSPFWASSFFRGEKGTKTPPGETHIAVRNRFPPAPPRSPPAPPHLRGPTASSRPGTVRRGRGTDSPRNRAAAAAGLKSRWPGRLEQTGAPDRSGSNLCGGESAGGSQIRPPVLCRGMFPRYPVGEGLAPPAVSWEWPWFAVGAHSVRPPSVDHDARRARRLGAPPLGPFRRGGTRRTGSGDDDKVLAGWQFQLAVIGRFHTGVQIPGIQKDLVNGGQAAPVFACLLYTSPSPRDTR